MEMMSCQSMHPPLDSSETTGKGNDEIWRTNTFLRVDTEELCYGENHLAHILLVAMPSFLLYALGLPVGAFLILWQQRELLKSNKYRFRMGLLYSG